MAKNIPVSAEDIQQTVADGDDMHVRLSDLQTRAERMCLLTVGTLDDATALMRLSRMAHDLAYSIVLGAKAKQERALLEAELRQYAAAPAASL